jgi:hypothetical protein
MSNFHTSVKAIESYVDNLFRCYPHLTELELLNKFKDFASDNGLHIVLELVGYSYFPIAHEKFNAIKECKNLVKVKQHQLN